MLMATALFLWSALNRNPDDDREKNAAPQQPPRANVPRAKGKRGGRSANPPQKRPPQRGMGVAQLEKLRLQERWKKLTEAEVSPPENSAVHFPFSFIDHPRALSLARSSPISYGAFNGFICHPAAGLSTSGAGSMNSDISTFHPSRLGEFESRLQSRSIIAATEKPRELSSNQKTQCFLPSCEFCAQEMQAAEAGSALAKGKLVAEFRPVEYDFFPGSGTGTVRGSGETEPIVAGIPADTAATIDLSLKLSFW